MPDRQTTHRERSGPIGPDRASDRRWTRPIREPTSGPAASAGPDPGDEPAEPIEEREPLAGWPPRDILAPFVLLAVSLQRAHGYVIEDYLRALGLFGITMSTLYRTLRQMEKDGFLESTWEPGPTGPARRVYTITDAGHDWLDSSATMLNAYRETIDRFFGLYDAGRARCAPAAQPTDDPARRQKETAAMTKTDGSGPSRPIRSRSGASCTTTNERAWSAALEQAMGSAEFGESSGKLLETMLAAQKSVRDNMRTYLETMNVPTREDIARLGELVVGLEEKVDQVVDRLDGVEEAVRAQRDRPAGPPDPRAARDPQDRQDPTGSTGPAGATGPAGPPGPTGPMPGPQGRPGRPDRRPATGRSAVRPARVRPLQRPSPGRPRPSGQSQPATRGKAPTASTAGTRRRPAKRARAAK